MNCSVIDQGGRLIINLTLSERNVEALKVKPILRRITQTQNGKRVLMVVEVESDEIHYHSIQRDEEFRGVAGGLHRFDEDTEIYIPKEG